MFINISSQGQILPTFPYSTQITYQVQHPKDVQFVILLNCNYKFSEVWWNLWEKVYKSEFSSLSAIQVKLYEFIKRDLCIDDERMQEIAKMFEDNNSNIAPMLVCEKWNIDTHFKYVDDYIINEFMKHEYDFLCYQELDDRRLVLGLEQTRENSALLNIIAENNIVVRVPSHEAFYNLAQFVPPDIDDDNLEYYEMDEYSKEYIKLNVCRLYFFKRCIKMIHSREQ